MLWNLVPMIDDMITLIWPAYIPKMNLIAHVKQKLLPAGHYDPPPSPGNAQKAQSG